MPNIIGSSFKLVYESLRSLNDRPEKLQYIIVITPLIKAKLAKVDNGAINLNFLKLAHTNMRGIVSSRAK